MAQETQKNPGARQENRLTRFTKNLIGGMIGLAILFFIITGIVFFKTTDQYDTLAEKTRHFKEFLNKETGTIAQNIKLRVMPPRRMPFSLLQQQDELKQLAPAVFREFSREDWQIFWNVIYGYKEVGDGPIKQIRFRTQAEIERYLSSKYEGAFVLENRGLWSRFWKIIRLDRSFKHVEYDANGRMLVERGDRIQIPD